MNIHNMITGGNVSIKEINQGISTEEIALLCQAIESKAEEDQKLKGALQDLRRVLETEKPSAAKAVASRLLENFSVSTLANALGGSMQTIIQKLAGM